MSKSDLYQFVSHLSTGMEWSRKALCRKAGSRAEWFVCDEDDPIVWNGEEFTGRRAHLLAAEKYCSECDAQYDCAMWALRNEEPVGVWGMTIRDMLWLQRFGGGEMVVEAAKFHGEPVQVTVRRVRRCVNKAELEAEDAADLAVV